MSDVLIVDDDPQFRTLVSKLLTARGHNVTEAGTGKAGTVAVESTRPDLVIVDGLLPDGDGVRWIEGRRGQGDTTPILFVSAFWKDIASFQHLTRELGVAAVMRKPVPPAELVGQVDAVLRRVAKDVTAEVEFLDPDDVEIVEADGEVEFAPEAAAAAELEVEVEPAMDPELAAALAEAARAYGEALPGKIEEISSLVDRLRRCPSDAEAALGCRSAAHKLSGTAGSYNYAGVGEAASAIEGLAVRAQAGARVSIVEWSQAVVLLRRAFTEASGQAPAPAAPPRPAERLVALHRVLVVDDDAEFLAAMFAQGRRRGLAIEGQPTAELALASVRDSAPDAVIIDVNLPGSVLSSFELARALRLLPDCADLPLAFVSGKGPLDDRIAATHAGGTLYLSKPLDADTLATAVHLLTTQRRPAQPRVLVVDDDTDALSLLGATLGRDGMETASLQDPSRILEVIEDTRPDVMLLDGIMAGTSGLDVCRTIRSMPRWQDLVIIFVSAEGAMAPRLAALRAGADDYLVKPVAGEELLARIRVRLERSRVLRDRLERDLLTGLPLRRVFLERLSARLGEACRRHRPLTVALLDVDHFKLVNDQHGHAAGDQVLAALGNLLARRFRAEDLRGRFGGEEFALAFSEEVPETVAHILERVLAEFAAMRFHGRGGEAFHCTFSGGVAGTATGCEPLESLLGAADAQLYTAKGEGRSRVVWNSRGLGR
jgi:diguanylate cyclase (GGDEF)-like protein